MNRLNINKEMIGNHVKFLESYSNERRWKCNPKSAKDTDVPVQDIINKYRLPNLSINNVASKPEKIVDNARIVTIKLGVMLILLFVRIISE